MKRGKIQTAILDKKRLAHSVYPVDDRVYVTGSRACQQARILSEQGLVQFQSTSEFNCRIGNNWDGSWKYGNIIQGYVVDVDSNRL